MKQQNQFIKVKGKIINLNKVSNIKIINKNNGYVVFFNFNYSININKSDKVLTISDYAEFGIYNDKDISRFKTELKLNSFIENNFIEYYNGYINKNEISCIKQDDYNNKIIINLSNPKSFKAESGEYGITSEFIFINCRSVDEYNNQLNSIINEIM